MARGAAARRYAKALYEIASEAAQIDAIRGDLEGFGALLERETALRDVLLRPLHPVAQRRAVLDAVLTAGGAGSTLRSFFSLLIDQRRLLDIDAIIAEYAHLADEAAGTTKARVESASPLTEQQIERLQAALRSRTGREIELTVHVDPSLLGGVVAQVGDLVFDGSLKTQLGQLRASLAQD